MLVWTCLTITPVPTRLSECARHAAAERLRGGHCHVNPICSKIEQQKNERDALKKRLSGVKKQIREEQRKLNERRAVLLGHCMMDLVAWIIPKDVLSLGFSTQGIT